MVRIKGAAEPVWARRLLGMREPIAPAACEVETGRSTVGVSAVASLFDRAIDGHGAVVGVVGPPGIGKSRLVREVVAIALVASRCSPATASRTLARSRFMPSRGCCAQPPVSQDLDGQEARDRVRDRVPDADPDDVALLDDLLGIADPSTPLPPIDPDARRRRLTALVNAASLARKTPAVYVIEDAHWIDEVSESMLTEFFTVIPQTPSLVLITYRPEYRGALAHAGGAQSIALAPLSDPETAALVSQLLGPHLSVRGLGQTIAEKAAGNPFFAEEIVRELAERGVLEGSRAHTSQRQSFLR